MTGYSLPAGAVIVERAGDRKRREAATRAQKEAEALRRPIRHATDLLLNADREERARRDHLAAMEREHAAVVALIADLRARLSTAKGESLPEVARKVAAARARLEALAGDVERAQRIADANAVVAEGAR